MNPDVVNELRDFIEGQQHGDYPDDPDVTVVLEHALAEIIRLNDIVETNRLVHGEMYGRNNNGFPSVS